MLLQSNKLLSRCIGTVRQSLPIRHRQWSRRRIARIGASRAKILPRKHLRNTSTHDEFTPWGLQFVFDGAVRRLPSSVNTRDSFSQYLSFWS